MGELTGYAGCSTVLQDLTAQRQALAAVRSGDTLYIFPADSALAGQMVGSAWMSAEKPDPSSVASSESSPAPRSYTA